MCGLVAASSAMASDAQAGIDIRAFGGNEKLGYLNLSFGTALGEDTDWHVSLLGTYAKRATFVASTFSVAHGGSDMELLGTYAPKGLPFTVSIGAAVPSTPSRMNETDCTYRAQVNAIDRNGLQLYANSYGALSVTPLLIAGVGGSYKLGAAKVSASVGTPFHGSNSVNLTTGLPDRVTLYSVGVEWGLHFLKDDQLSVSLTNQVGWTTGMQATSTLGGTAGVAVAYTVKF